MRALSSTNQLLALYAAEAIAAGTTTHRYRQDGYPFDDPDWLFDFKYDGFRALCLRIEKGRCRFISRNGHALRRVDRPRK